MGCLPLLHLAPLFRAGLCRADGIRFAAGCGPGLWRCPPRADESDFSLPTALAVDVARAERVRDGRGDDGRGDEGLEVSRSILPLTSPRSGDEAREFDRTRGAGEEARVRAR